MRKAHQNTTIVCPTYAAPHNIHANQTEQNRARVHTSAPTVTHRARITRRNIRQHIHTHTSFRVQVVDQERGLKAAENTESHHTDTSSPTASAAARSARLAATADT